MTLRPDAQAFDEIRITTVPRYKTSELSGDEWRISARVEFFRKGVLCLYREYRNVETATGFLYADWHRAIDDGKADFGSIDNICDQEGCDYMAVHRYKLKHTYCREGHKSEASERDRRQFCEAHKKRGDCGLDDADSNYEACKP